MYYTYMCIYTCIDLCICMFIRVDPTPGAGSWWARALACMYIHVLCICVYERI